MRATSAPSTACSGDALRWTIVTSRPSWRADAATSAPIHPPPTTTTCSGARQRVAQSVGVVDRAQQMDPARGRHQARRAGAARRRSRGAGGCTGADRRPPCARPGRPGRCPRPRHPCGSPRRDPRRSGPRAPRAAHDRTRPAGIPSTAPVVRTGRCDSAVSRTMLPSKPCSRAPCTALAAASPPPMTMIGLRCMSPTPVRLARERDELGARACVVTQEAVDGGRDGRAPGRADAALRHARVFADEDDTDAARIELFVQAVGDLVGEALLQLQPVRVEVDDAGELREPEDPRRGYVPDVRDASEREQVVFAHRDERDVAREDELVVALVVGERRERERPRREQFGIRRGDPTRRVPQRSRRGIVPERARGAARLPLRRRDRRSRAPRAPVASGAWPSTSDRASTEVMRGPCAGRRWPGGRASTRRAAVRSRATRCPSSRR